MQAEAIAQLSFFLLRRSFPRAPDQRPNFRLWELLFGGSIVTLGLWWGFGGLWLLTPDAPVADEWRDVIVNDAAKPIRTRIVWRPSLAVGARVEGPAVIEEPNATTLIHPGDVATVSDAGHLVIDVALA